MPQIDTPARLPPQESQQQYRSAITGVTAVILISPLPTRGPPSLGTHVSFELRPLDLAEVGAFLSGGGRDARWDGVIAALADPDSVLAKVLSVPLFVSLASAVRNELPHHEDQRPPALRWRPGSRPGR